MRLEMGIESKILCKNSSFPQLAPVLYMGIWFLPVVVFVAGRGTYLFLDL